MGKWAAGVAAVALAILFPVAIAALVFFVVAYVGFCLLMEKVVGR